MLPLLADLVESVVDLGPLDQGLGGGLFKELAFSEGPRAVVDLRRALKELALAHLLKLGLKRDLHEPLFLLLRLILQKLLHITRTRFAASQP